MYNPFIGNYIMDAFTTEVGAELYLRAEGALTGIPGELVAAAGRLRAAGT
jgi:hypothetical protein